MKSLISLLVIVLMLTGCTIGQRKMVARSGATYGTVKVLKSMKVSAEKADKIAEVARLALSGDKEQIKDAIAKVISKEFSR
jgi:type III secretory pathway lipoprotein EscJ